MVNAGRADAGNNKKMADCIVAEDLTKIFGTEQERALSMLERGMSAAEIRTATGSTPAVINNSFTVSDGEIFVVMGLSGSGKSTLVRMINGLILPTAGRLMVKGADVADMSFSELVALRRESVSMVFQSFALLPHLSVRQNVAFGLKISGVSADKRRDIAEETLAHVGLEGYGDSHPDELSGGMQQRVGLARALAVDPDILLMDEAFSALDPLIRSEMQDDLLALQARRARTIIFISHDLEEAMRLGDRIAVLESGRLAQAGTPAEILANPANDYVRAFFRNVDVTQVYTAERVAHRPSVVVADRPGFGVRNLVDILARHDTNYGVVTDRAGKYLGMVEMDSLVSAAAGDPMSTLSTAFVSMEPVECDALLCDLLGRAGQSYLPLPVVAEDGRFLGVLGKSEILLMLDRANSERVSIESEQECREQGES